MVGDRLGTAGQPTLAQFQWVRESGFEAVINLALPTSDNAIAHEGSVVTGLGMAYFHIPVDFKAPTAQRNSCGPVQHLFGEGSRGRGNFRMDRIRPSDIS